MYFKFCVFKIISYVCITKADQRGTDTVNKRAMETINFSIRELNLDYRIKVSGERNGVKYHTLVGVSGLVSIIGVELTNKFVARVYRTCNDKEVCRLRSGLVVTFYKK